MTHRGLRAAGLIMTGALALLVAACGEDGDVAATSTTRAATTVAPATIATRTADTTEATDPSTTGRPTTTHAPTTTAAATTVPATTVVETTIADTTTTTAPATTAVPLPQPVSPPPPRSDEAHVELGTIEIPKIGISKPLLEGISLNTLDKAPGHWPGTAMPGQPGNVVVAGHRTSKDRPFRHIDQLVPGDEVIFNTADGRFVYTVTDTQIVLPNAMWIVTQTPASTATLFACHPVGSTAERIVVFLQLQA